MHSFAGDFRRLKQIQVLVNKFGDTFRSSHTEGLGDALVDNLQFGRRFTVLVEVLFLFRRENDIELADRFNIVGISGPCYFEGFHPAQPEEFNQRLFLSEVKHQPLGLLRQFLKERSGVFDLLVGVHDADTEGVKCFSRLLIAFSALHSFTRQAFKHHARRHCVQPKLLQPHRDSGNLFAGGTSDLRELSQRGLELGGFPSGALEVRDHRNIGFIDRFRRFDQCRAKRNHKGYRRPDRTSRRA